MRTPAEDGFTLIETLVALVVLAMTSIALYQNYEQGMRGLRVADGEAQALALARSLLAETGISKPLVEGRTSGVGADGLAWTITTRHHEPSHQGQPVADVGNPLYRIDVETRWRDRPGRQVRSVVLTTFKLGAPS